MLIYSALQVISSTFTTKCSLSDKSVHYRTFSAYLVDIRQKKPSSPWIFYHAEMKIFSLTFKQLQESLKKSLWQIRISDARPHIFESSTATQGLQIHMMFKT